MTDTTEAQQPQQSFEGFRVLDERDAWGNMVVETPSTFQLPIQTDDPNIALKIKNLKVLTKNGIVTTLC